MPATIARNAAPWRSTGRRETAGPSGRTAKDRKSGARMNGQASRGTRADAPGCLQKGRRP